MAFSETLLLEFDEEMKNTRKLLERIPDGKFDFKPHAKSMSLAELSTHVAQLPSWASHLLDQDVLYIDPNMKAEVVTSRTELLERFDRHVAEARDKIRAASDSHWQQTWTFKVGGKTLLTKPRAAVMRMDVLNHLIHHRAQLGVYLRLNNVAIPGMYGPSADDPAMGATQAA